MWTGIRTVEGNRVYGLECQREASYRERSFREMYHVPLMLPKLSGMRAGQDSTRLSRDKSSMENHEAGDTGLLKHP